MTMVAMKMEHAIKAPKDGIIKSVLATEGQVFHYKHVLLTKLTIYILDCRQESSARSIC